MLNKIQAIHIISKEAAPRAPKKRLKIKMGSE